MYKSTITICQTEDTSDSNQNFTCDYKLVNWIWWFPHDHLATCVKLNDVNYKWSSFASLKNKYHMVVHSHEMQFSLRCSGFCWGGNEYALMKKIKHPNVLCYWEYALTLKMEFHNFIALLFENLATCIVKEA